ncbi:peptide/nickel transport system ATP-binding protein [Palleronia aestuarii]|uniref:Peptide/nickel transport system ATP-binding protein n=1 Tax=Palleronia aestuarii TaxID=568105 RepID=A0A2W7N0S7_9RHOB|nr:ATP-binding cassette domain-containing protein [Palleronia aestuarii]PZX13738.1 peptide/nickel transport system ATP-binding protein [Palleronia aestuarii]
MLSAERIGHAFGGSPVLSEASLALGAGEIVGLGGMSGSGKSTLGRILGGHLVPQSGRVRLDGAPLPPPGVGRPAPVQYAPQAAELAVDPRWRIGRILANGGTPDPEAIAALGVAPAWTDRHPSELSGGELARVSLARFFHPGLRALVCDEITAQLDALEQAALLERLTGVARRRGLALLLVSHSAGLRARYCDRSLILTEGRLVPEAMPR